ncbi:hypothetical protein E3P86_01710 [Wallemia ichthyophaga]|uniref:60S acidic ribosomal protein P2 n=1 Tax=Wallemia ichthyophaga TaxID=245174 RepID=A0A4T0J6Z3_WALIC|nr:hypothetical protein E3P86_01710 [Wallemia ichthyophaga]
MKLVAAYLLLTVGGNTSPSAEDVKKLLSTVGIEADDSRLNKLIEEVNGKNIEELIAQGTEKLASVPSASAAAAPAAGAAPAAAEEAPKKEEAKEESDDDMGLVPTRKIVEESDVGFVEYKLKLTLNTTKDRLDRYMTQMKFRLLQGRGRCLYQIGVLDDGHLIGLDDAALEDSFECLKYMTKELGLSMCIQRILNVTPLQVIHRKPHKRTKKSINDGISPSEPLSVEEQHTNQQALHSILDNIHKDDDDDDDLDHLFCDVVESNSTISSHLYAETPPTPPANSPTLQIAEIFIYAP